MGRIDSAHHEGQAMKRIFLIRHGETEWSRSGKHTSVTDLPLTARGEEQALALRAELDRLGVSPSATVWSSPRLRARHTAELAGFTDVSIEPDAVEWAYGRYEGLTTPEIREHHPHWQIFDDGCPDGESVAEFSGRIDRLVERALAEEELVIVAHGHLSRGFTARMLGAPVGFGRRIEVLPASISVFGTDRDGAVQLRAAGLTGYASGDYVDGSHAH